MRIGIIFHNLGLIIRLKIQQTTLCHTASIEDVGVDHGGLHH